MTRRQKLFMDDVMTLRFALAKSRKDRYGSIGDALRRQGLLESVHGALPRGQSYLRPTTEAFALYGMKPTELGPQALATNYMIFSFTDQNPAYRFVDREKVRKAFGPRATRRLWLQKEKELFPVYAAQPFSSIRSLVSRAKREIAALEENETAASWLAAGRMKLLLLLDEAQERKQAKLAKVLPLTAEVHTTKGLLS